MSSITDEIKNRCNIVDVVGRYVQLKRSGSNYLGLCPFHSEKTPSFSVSEEKQFFHCFGCGESGDVISFVEKIENVDFLTAVQKLAEQYGINMDDYGYRNESRKNRLYEMNRDAAMFFLHHLTDRPNPGRDYILNRGLDMKTIARFGIGYAPDSWSSLLDYMTSNGYEPAQLAAAGLVSNSKGKYYDKFRNRVIFPIISTRGKVLGFGGRIISDGQPKYLNSPETPVFSKRNNLFGLNLTRKSIEENDCAIIVEGYMDLVSLYQSGVTHVAATLGTALTADQCKMLKRYTDNIILSYDADQAGRAAALRGIEVIRSAGLNGRVLHVTDGKDPDEYVRRYGRDAFMKLTESALPYADYKLEHARSGFDLSTDEGMTGYTRAAAAVIRDLDPLESELYIHKVSESTGMQEGSLRKTIKKLAKLPHVYTRDMFPPHPAAGTASERGTQTAGVRLQKTMIGLMANNPDLVPLTVQYAHIFEEPVWYRIADVLFTLFQEDGTIDINKAADTLGGEDADLFITTADSEVFSEDPEQNWKECVGRIKIKELQQKNKDLENALELLPEDDVRTEEIMIRMKKIDNKIRKLKENPGSYEDILRDDPEQTG